MSAGAVSAAAERPEAAGEAPRCANCGTPVADRYCPHCGQQRSAHLLSLRRMAAEVADDQLSLDGTLPRTLFALFFRPGFLTREYVAGRIVRYTRPFRLFLISSLLFFLTLSYATSMEYLVRSAEEYTPPVQPSEGEGAPRWQNVGFSIDTAAAPQWSRPIARRVAQQEERLNSMPPAAAVGEIMEALLWAAARVSFLLVPGFAALLLFLHFRRSPGYVQHFVFALHFHAFIFLLMLPLLLSGIGWLWGAAALWATVYLLVALKRTYAQPWGLAGAKLAVVGIVYPVALGLVLTVAALAAVLLA